VRTRQIICHFWQKALKLFKLEILNPCYNELVHIFFINEFLSLEEVVTKMGDIMKHPF
jgi:hypothetical protein